MPVVNVDDLVRLQRTPEDIRNVSETLWSFAAPPCAVAPHPVASPAAGRH